MGTPVEGGNTEINFEPATVQDTGSDQSSTPGQNPAWNDVLSILPEQFHTVVTPHFQKWDQAANTRITDLNSQLGQYEQYKAFAEHGIDAEAIQQSLRLAQAIEQDPQGVYNALAEAYKFNQQTETAGEEETYTEEASQYKDPRVDALEQGVQMMAQLELERQQTMQAQEAETTLDRELAAAKQKYGDFNDQHVLPYISFGLDQGQTVEQAIDTFMAMKNQLLQNNPRPFAPSIMGGSSSGQGVGLPSQTVDVTKLSDKDTKTLVAEMLARAAQNNG